MRGDFRGRKRQRGFLELGGGAPASSQAWSYLGIPYPTYTNAALEALGYTAWPYDPCTRPIPDRPGTWESDISGYWYVKDGGINTGNGYPADPRGDIPQAADGVAAGDLIVYEGTGLTVTSEYLLNWPGTPEAPVFFVSNSGDPTVDYMDRGSAGRYATNAATHVIVDGIGFHNSHASAAPTGVFVVSANSSHVAVRNCIIDDLSGLRTGQGGGVTGTSISADHVLFYRTTIGPNGDWDSLAGGDNDYHGFGLHGTDIWVVECTFTQNQGDAIQISGEGGGSDPGDAVRIFIAGNELSEHHQTAVWTKDATDVIMSQNYAHDGYSGANSATHSAFGGQGDYTACWVIANRCVNEGSGVQFVGSDGGNNAYIIGNLVYDQDTDRLVDQGTDGTRGDSGYNNFGVSARNAGSAYILFNTIHTYGVSIGSRNSAPYIIGNYHDTPDDTLVEPGVYLKGTNTHLFSLNNPSEVDYNAFRGATIVADTGIADGANDFATTAPLFTNEAENDFSLQGGSPLKSYVPDAGTVAAVFDAFETRFGISIRRDFTGAVRTGNFSVGAYQ